MKEQLKDWCEDRLIQEIIAPHASDLSNDTALLEPRAGHQLLVSSDAMVEDIHFLRTAPAEWVGQKAVRVNASDIVADGGLPRWITLSLSLPSSLPVAWLRAFMAGVGTACRELDVVLVGGDTTRAPQHIAVNVTVLGEVPQGKAVSRIGAQPDHLIAVTGCLGDSFLGLAVMLQKEPPTPGYETRMLQRHFMPPNRGAFARAAASAGLISAMMDLSDGPASDLPRLCRRSKVGARVHLERLPRSEEGKQRISPSQVPGCGEDFELLLTCSPENRAKLAAVAETHDTPLHFVGHCTEPRDIVWLLDDREVSPPGGWQHFSNRPDAAKTT